VHRRQLLTRLVPLGAFGLAAACTTGSVPATADNASPTALVYRGPAGCPGCSEAVATVLRAAPRPFRIVYCGPGEQVAVSAESLSMAQLYVQPGGGNNLERAWSQLRAQAPAIRQWVHRGGHYLGICMGGYLAGFDPGFGLLPGDSGEYNRTKGATVRTSGDATVVVRWRGQPRRLYFQDGPSFTLHRGVRADVLATYSNGLDAALVVPYGRGRVGVCGPHPEAPASWYRESGFAPPAGGTLDLALDLVQTTMRA
jgi:glutamine amidotransferase-like uncharacterized protein